MIADEAWKIACKAPVTVKWVDTNKGTDEAARMRSRLAARDFKRKGEEDREFSRPHPPLELKRTFALKSASIPASGRVRKLLFADVKKGPPHSQARPGRVL